MSIEAWAVKHRVGSDALAELRALMITLPAVVGPGGEGCGESDAQRAVRVQASAAGWRLWRNNVGAGKLYNNNGSSSYVRFGLANESPQMNAIIKSSDLIGIRPIHIGFEHMGMVIGQFVCREVKRPGWRYTGTAHEVAQMKWIEVVTALGGDAKFTTGELL